MNYHLNFFFVLRDFDMLLIGLVVTLLAPLWHGGSVVLSPRFSARTFWRDAARDGCTWINVVPTIVAYLIDGEEPSGLDLSALKFCRSASAALPQMSARPSKCPQAPRQWIYAAGPVHAACRTKARAFRIGAAAGRAGPHGERS